MIAIADFDRAIKFDSNFAPAYINRGLILHRNRVFNVAFADSKPIRIDPGIFDVNRRTNSRLRSERFGELRKARLQSRARGVTRTP